MEAWSLSFQVLTLAPVFQTCLSPQDGPAYHLPQEVVLQHKEQQEEGGQDSWWQAGLPGKDLFRILRLVDERTCAHMILLQYLKKRPSVPKCPMTGLKLKGVTPATNQEKARMSRRQKTVFRYSIVQC